ncbi:MAG TPA: hypothetical protein VHX88_12015 [Solirubrobacteraceae bacterium]|nr:hypothetical protein [Solirubrobacteraceae bacterium]
MMPVRLRLATADDRGALERLAARGGMLVPAGPVLVADVDERMVAALAVPDGPVLADPRVQTGELIALLKLRAAQLTGAPRRRGRGRRRRQGLTPAPPPTVPRLPPLLR